MDKCPPLRSYPNKSPPPGAKTRMQKPQGGGKFLMQIPGVCGGIVMDEIDTCIKQSNTWHYLELFCCLLYGNQNVPVIFGQTLYSLKAKSGLLNISRCTQDIPPMYSWYPPIKMLTKNVRRCNTELLPIEVKETFDTYLAIH